MKLKIKKRLKIYSGSKIQNNIKLLQQTCKLNKFNFLKKFLFWNLFFLNKFKIKKNKLRIKKNRQVNGLIIFRLFKLQLENIIFFTCKRFLDISISNVFLTRGIINYRKKIGVKIKKQEFRFIFYLLLLSSQYNESKMIANYLANNIKTTKKHYLVLRNFINLLEYFFFKNIINFLGFQLRLNGKLGGKMRKSKYHYKLGKVWLQMLQVYLSYTLAVSFTKFGVISIKVWFLNGDKYL